jgi:hypothetical protein
LSHNTTLNYLLVPYSRYLIVLAKLGQNYLLL